MAINKKLIHFNKKSDFNTKSKATSATDTSADILYSSIVFIKDTQEIWTHGQFYKSPYTQEELEALFGDTVKRSEMGVADGVATLDADGKVSALQLPSYVENIDFDETTTDEGYKFTVTTKNPSDGTSTDKTLNVGIATDNSPGLMTPEEKLWMYSVGPSYSDDYSGNYAGIYVAGLDVGGELSNGGNKPNDRYAILNFLTSEDTVSLNTVLMSSFDNEYKQVRWNAPIPAATTSEAGVMTAADKNKLDKCDNRVDNLCMFSYELPFDMSSEFRNMFENETNRSSSEIYQGYSPYNAFIGMYEKLKEYGDKGHKSGKIEIIITSVNNEPLYYYYLDMPVYSEILIKNDAIMSAPKLRFVNAGGYIMEFIAMDAMIYDFPATGEEDSNYISKSNITNDLGTSEELVMSQKGVTDAINNLEDTIEETIETSIDGVGSVLHFNGIIEDSITVLLQSTTAIGQVLFSVDQGAFVCKVGGNYFSNWATITDGIAKSEAYKYNESLADNNEGGQAKTDRFFEYNNVLYYSDGLGLYPISTNLVQETGQSTSEAMSQKAVTDAINDLENRLGTTQILTQSEYDNLTTKSDNVIYFIKG